MNPSRGFALPSAIFLLVILSMLGAFMLTFSSQQQISSAQDLQGSRAYRAAQLGMEWMAAQLCNGAPCAAPLAACPVGAPYVMNVAPNGFTVTVTCATTSALPYDEAGANNRTIFWVTSTARSPGAVGGIGYTERQLNAFIEFPVGP
ncbi:MAG TPA: hypothetical protein VJ001_12590 [Rhodocyclaceae bacterium]|nr:hypothetical protein [Rhodocyclaceae bacterium]